MNHLRRLLRRAGTAALFFCAWWSFGQTKPPSTQLAEGYFIDLPTVLRLAHAQNLDVQIARERLAEAKANRTGAEWQFLPWLEPGISYRHHEGRVQAVDGPIFDASKQSYAPGVALNAQVEPGEAYYLALEAKQLVQVAGQAMNSRDRDVALTAVQGYFELLLTGASVEVAKEALRISSNYQAQAERAADAGVAFRGDALRVQVQSERNRFALEQAEEQRRLASTRLAQVLNLDPVVHLEVNPAELVPVSLIESNTPVGALVGQARRDRPELRQSQAALEAARNAKQGASYGPLFPTVGAQVFAGGLGGGTGGSFGNFADQQDYFVGLSWRIGPGGLFDRGRTKAAEARARAAALEAEKAEREVARQVADAAVRVESLSRQVRIARDAMKVAEQGLNLARDRQEFGVGIVLENIQAEQELTRARLDFARAVAEHNKAQYALAYAVGRKL